MMVEVKLVRIVAKVCQVVQVLGSQYNVHLHMFPKAANGIRYLQALMTLQYMLPLHTRQQLRSPSLAEYISHLRRDHIR